MIMCFTSFWCNFHGVTFLKMDINRDINSALNPYSIPTEHEEDLEIRTDEISGEPIPRPIQRAWSCSTQ